MMTASIVIIILLLVAFLTSTYVFRLRKANDSEVQLIPEMRALPLACRPWVADDGLDIHQQQALTSPARITLVLAGAGAGKTKVLTKRIVLLNRHLGVPLENMMVLAFNDAAAKEVSQRVADQLGMSVERLFKKNIRTIHSLAYEIYRSSQFAARVVSEEKELRNVLKEILIERREAPQGAKYVDEVVELFGDYPRIQMRSFDRKKENASRAIRCSDGTRVRSKMEKAIVEELARRGIDYIYEPTVTWADRYFQPDFFLPAFDAYIEFWGMHDHEDATLREKYRRDELAKKDSFKKFGFYLIDVYPASKEHPTDPIRFLGKRLDGLSGKSSNANGAAKLQRIFNAMEDQVIEVVLGTHAILTSYGKTLKEVLPTDASLLRRILVFTSPLCDALEARLKEQGKTTFSLFLKEAVTALKANPAVLRQYQRAFRFVFVDEVQDLMPMTREFIQCLVGPDQSLFAIGDDYQSIYSFAGSDPGTIVKFDRYFKGAHRVSLVNNYRCHPRIVDASNAVIAHNTVQVFKEARGVYRTGQAATDRPVTVITLQNVPAEMDRLIDLVMGAIPADENLTVLSRYREGNPTVVPWIKAFKAKGFARRVNFLTIHKSKGLEADNILLVQCVEHPDEKYSFPAGDGVQSVRNQVLDLCRGADFSLEEEETRLFYVALTRAKKRVFIQTVKGKESRFTTDQFLPRELVSVGTKGNQPA